MHVWLVVVYFASRVRRIMLCFFNFPLCCISRQSALEMFQLKYGWNMLECKADQRITAIATRRHKKNRDIESIRSKDIVRRDLKREHVKLFGARRDPGSKEKCPFVCMRVRAPHIALFNIGRQRT